MAYGSNISSQRMLIERKINFISRKLAIIENYKLLFNKVSKKNQNIGFANIVECENCVVEGALYEINDKDITIIDKFEGAPFHYQRKNINVICENQIKQAIVYIANPTMIRENIMPNKNYMNYLLTGKDIFSKDYYENLLSTKTID
jgi:gamma-glutamylcyclotransferase (GGCT)/AIG2-like uncharacterized protein YtfP